MKEQARLYFNQRIGATFSEVIKEYRRRIRAAGGQVRPEVVDRRAYNVKEFELQQLKKDAGGVLNGIIDLHIKALRKRRMHSGHPDRKFNQTRGGFRAYSPLKKARNQNSSRLVSLQFSCTY
jgi:ribosomal protein L44E